MTAVGLDLIREHFRNLDQVELAELAEIRDQSNQLSVVKTSAPASVAAPSQVLKCRTHQAHTIRQIGNFRADQSNLQHIRILDHWTDSTNQRDP